jgi:tetratricopeptide (TPR) repeat protein
MTESRQGNYQAAQQIFDEGRYIFDRIHDATLQQVLQSELGHLARHTGRLPEAKAIYRKTIRNWQESGNRGAIANQLECFGFLASADKEPQRAIKLFSAAEALRKKARSPRTNQEQEEFDRSVAQLRGMLAEAEFKALWDDADRMPTEQAVQFAVDG